MCISRLIEAPRAPGGPFGLRNLARFRTDARPFAQSLRAISDQLVQMRVGPAHGYAVFDADLVHEVLVRQWRAFRKLPEAVRFLDRTIGRSLISTEGEEWLAERRHLMGFFQPSRVDELLPRLAGLAGRRFDELSRGQSFDLGEYASSLMLDVTTRLLLGVEVAGAAERVHRGLALLGSVPAWITSLVLLAPRAPLPRAARVREALALIDGVAAELTAAWAHGGAGASAPGALLACRPDGGPAEPATVRSRMLMMLSAGHVTMTIALSWVLDALLEHPEAHDRMHDPAYAERFVREALRLHPPFWALIPRQARETLALGPYRIHERAWIDIFPWLLHRDPRYFPDPERFDPDRFAPGGEVRPGAYLPFGLGPHVCAGQAIAMRMLVTVVQTVTGRARLGRAGDRPRGTGYGGLLVLGEPLLARRTS